MTAPILSRFALGLVFAIGFLSQLCSSGAAYAQIDPNEVDVNVMQDEARQGEAEAAPKKTTPKAAHKSTKKSSDFIAKKTKAKQKKISTWSDKKHRLKTTLPAKKGAVASAKTVPERARPILGTPDPNVDEPSEMVTAIKSKAQDKFWQGKRPYPEQLKDMKNPVLTRDMAQRELEHSGNHDMPNKDGTPRRVSYSDIAGVTFDDQPLRMNASDTFRRSLETVSFELGRPCKDQEYLGWPMQQSEQERVDRIFEDTNAKFKLRGYNLQPRKARSLGTDVSAFTADLPTKRILGIWSAGDVGLLLLMCNTDVPKETYATVKPKKETKPKKPKKVKAKAKKKPAAAASAPTAPVSAAAPETAPMPATTGATQPDVPSAPMPAAASPAALTPPANPPANPPMAEPITGPVKMPESKPQVIPGAPPVGVAPEAPVPPPAATPPGPGMVPTAPPQTSAPAAPSNAFIPADTPKAPAAPAPDASMKAMPPEMPVPPPAPSAAPATEPAKQ